MPKAIISDTSCFIVLTNIGELSLLSKVYGSVITTTEVAFEYGQTLPDWVEITSVKDNSRQQILEIQDSTLILDDYKARKIAELLGLKITGTIGVIIKAKLNGVIPSIRPYLDKIRKTDFYISDEIERLALKEAEE